MSCSLSSDLCFVKMTCFSTSHCKFAGARLWKLLKTTSCERFSYSGISAFLSILCKCDVSTCKCHFFLNSPRTPIPVFPVHLLLIYVLLKWHVFQPLIVSLLEQGCENYSKPLRVRGSHILEFQHFNIIVFYVLFPLPTFTSSSSKFKPLSLLMFLILYFKFEIANNGLQVH